MIQIFNLYKTYGSTPALIDISLAIKEKDFVYITGPSGAGKSTLLKVLYRRESFSRGQILVKGINISKIKAKNLYTLRRKVGIVFQDYKLLPKKTVFENIAFAQEMVGASSKAIKFNTWDALKKVRLTHKKDSFPPQLSGGEQQRVAIARALVNSPPILLADEPTGNLDPDMAQEIFRLFEEANRRGMTVVFATHSQEMLKLGNHPVITLNRGRIKNS